MSKVMAAPIHLEMLKVAINQVAVETSDVYCLNKAPLVGAFLLLARKNKSIYFNGLQGAKQNFTKLYKQDVLEKLVWGIEKPKQNLNLKQKESLMRSELVLDTFQPFQITLSN